ncbi:MAG: hypothetical protein ACWGO1_09515, partial [Anaerolineales bacterium]
MCYKLLEKSELRLSELCLGTMAFGEVFGWGSSKEESRRVSQIEDNLGCLEFSLTDEQMTRLDELADFKVGFPNSFLKNDHVRGLIFGETFSFEV